ncbi:TPA: bacteriocin leader domain-containing protein [Streptococcus suis]
MNNFGKLENQFLCLSDTDLQYVSGGSYNFKVDIDKLVDYATRAFGSIYNAGKSFGRNWYNAFY